MGYQENEKVGDMLKRLRGDRPQREIARKTGFDKSPNLISMYETGNACIPFEKIGNIVEVYSGKKDDELHKTIIQILYPEVWETVSGIIRSTGAQA